MSLFTFHNEFDDVDVILDDESPDIKTHGPFSVRQVFGDRSISAGENPPQEDFALLSEAKARFLQLVEGEIDAVLSQGEHDVVTALKVLNTR